MEKMLTVDQAADALQISRTKLFDLLRTGVLRSVKIGRARRVPASSIDQYINELLGR
jgi:excisionase family DNA binding protein